MAAAKARTRFTRFDLENLVTAMRAISEMDVHVARAEIQVAIGEPECLVVYDEEDDTFYLEVL